MEKFSRFTNAFFIFTLTGILTAAYYQQFFKHERPCPLCLLQRLSMFGIALGLFINLTKGISPLHYGFSIIFAVYGGTVSLRQVALHACPNFPVFGIPVWGFELFTWAFLVFAISIFAIAILLFLMPKEQVVKKMDWFESLAAILLLILMISNCYTTFLECSLGPCVDIPWPQPSST